METHEKPFRSYTGDVEQLIETLSERFDLVFADPPYAEGLPEQVLRWLEHHTRQDGRLVYERSRQDTAPLGSEIFKLEKEKVVAETRIQIYKVNSR